MKNLKSITWMMVFLAFSNCNSLKSINPLSVLTDNTWELSSLLGQDVIPDQFSGGFPSLDFSEGGKLSGFSGCNNFNGSFSLEGDQLQLDPGAMTRKACPGSGEQDFMNAFNQVTRLKIKDQKLTLLDGSRELMTLMPQQN
ncbi:META domain-containing protein [Algoriphagus namhaensis]